MSRWDENDAEFEQSMIKTAFLSYYISVYNTVNDEIGYEKAPVTADEIFDFITDLKHEGGKNNIPDITRKDVLFAFRILKNAGICKDVFADVAPLTN